MAIWDRIKNIINGQDYEVKPLQIQEQVPKQQLPAIQMREDGSMYEIPSPTSDNRATIGQKLNYALFGVPTRDVIATDDNGRPVYSSENIREGGILRDISGGYNENRKQNFSLNNWGENKGGFARRFGEGLGSLVKFAESPAGRALLTGAAVGMTGGNGLQALAYGTMAGAKNQTNRMADRMYRDDLERQGVDTSNITGYVNDDVYTNMLRSKQLQDNAEYRKLYYDTQLENHKIDQALAREKLNYQKAQDAANRALQYAELNERRRANNMSNALAYEKLLQEKTKGGEGFGDIEAQLNNFSQSFKNVNNPYRYRIAGGASEFLNTLTPAEANFNSQRTLLFNQIARKLGGEKGVLSDQDIKRIDNALPKLTDTYAQKQAKMKAVYSLLDIKKGSAGKDSLGIL